MESESQYDELITRYLLNEASPEEEQFIMEWMAADEKNRLYVQELGNTLEIVRLSMANTKIDVNKEWEQLRRVVLHNQSKVLPIYSNKKADDFINSSEQKSGGAKIYKFLIGAVIAASVIFIIGSSIRWFSSNDIQENKTAKHKTLVKEKAKIDPLMAVVHHEVNTSGKTKLLILPDGSKIALFNNSELTYKEPANGKRRDIFMKGKADFSVVKNNSKPFTVFSEEISTTAIGTVFAVEANEGDKYIRVRLTEGKVVVRSLKGYNESWKGDRYLVPGQELVYDKQRKTVLVTSFVMEKPVRKQVAAQLKENPSIPNYDKRSWFMFNNQPLSEIFDALSEMYNVKIVYPKKDVKDMYFIGTYDKSDSLDKILKQIALLNNLNVTRQNDTFKIERQITKKKG